MKTFRHFRLILGVFLCVVTTVAGGMILSQQPDFNLVLDRKIPSPFKPEHLNRSLQAPSRWQQWFHSVARVTGASTIETGSKLSLKIDPKKGKRKQFELSAEVIRFVPEQLLELKITEDSSGRLTQLFDQIEWKIEISPTPKGSLIHATATAHTKSWRARLFGRLAEKIVMNQVFYPNIIQLAELKQPFSIDEAPHLPAGSM